MGRFIVVAVFGYTCTICLGLELTPTDGRRFRAANRVAWIHVPKCGTSFANTLIHYANSSIPKDDYISTAYPDADKFLAARYPIDRWFRNVLWTRGDGAWGLHISLSDAAYQNFRGHVVSMFRRPSSRMFSAYLYHGVNDPLPLPDQELNRRFGLVTKMIAGQYGCQDGCTRTHCDGDCLHGCTVPDCPFIKPNVEKALARLDDFKFVGLTTQYDLSVCLFHAMLGGPCLPVEFVNMRPTKLKSNWVKNRTAVEQYFNGVHDPYDQPVYDKAENMFWNDIRKWKVDRQACEAIICPQAPARVFGLSSTTKMRGFNEFKYDWPGRLELGEE